MALKETWKGGTTNQNQRWSWVQDEKRATVVVGWRRMQRWQLHYHWVLDQQWGRRFTMAVAASTVAATARERKASTVVCNDDVSDKVCRRQREEIEQWSQRGKVKNEK